MLGKKQSLPLAETKQLTFSHYLRFLTIGEDRRKDQFRNWQIRSL